jgi:hypothetical protein
MILEGEDYGLKGSIRGLFLVVLIDFFGGAFRFNYLPLESILEIIKALRTYPMVIV